MGTVQRRHLAQCAIGMDFQLQLSAINHHSPAVGQFWQGETVGRATGSKDEFRIGRSLYPSGHHVLIENMRTVSYAMLIP